MFKLPDPPSSGAESRELADFAEFLALIEGITSAREILAALGRADENDRNFGCDDNDDEHANELDEVLNEIGQRRIICSSGYPFSLEREGTVLRYTPDDSDHRTHVYQYLLLSTRLDMQCNRTHANIDGAILLEEIAAHVLRCYLGGRRAKSIVFGTAVRGGFVEKVNQLCKELGEGEVFRNIDGSTRPTARDGKLDTVSWIPFSDNKKGKLIIFGQCKTGSTWSDEVVKLQPADFIKKWIHAPYLVDPIRAFCVSEAIGHSRWNSYSVDAGLFLDRCRLVDFCEHIDAPLLKSIKSWNEAVKKTLRLPRKKKFKSKVSRTRKRR